MEENQVIDEGLRNKMKGRPERILMLVPHEPEVDPRIRWVTGLCTDIGRTDIICSVWSKDKVGREYDGQVYTERIDIHEYSSMSAKLFFDKLAGASVIRKMVRRYVMREEQRSASQMLAIGVVATTSELREESGASVLSTLRRAFARYSIRALFAILDHQVGAALRFLSAWAAYSLIITSLYRRARAISIIPRCIICHDIYALAAGVKIKKLYGCPILYDSHEFWPEADLLGQRWQRRLTTYIERRLIKQADVVVTVSPQLSRHLEQLYGLAKVVNAPNAEPCMNREPTKTRPCSLPLRFLFQGQAASGRGIEELLTLWSLLADVDAVLYLRCPENECFTYLRGKFDRMVQEKKVVILEAVRETDMMSAASFADVGIIPYLGPNLNHLLGCPNKLSQYMQAGLAIFSNRLTYVSEIVDRYRCGLIYDVTKPESFVEAIDFFINNTDELDLMKQHAIRSVHMEFNWEVQSVSYQNAVRSLYFRQLASP